MFDNIGGKIKALAKVVCWLGIICAALTGLGLIVSGLSAGGTDSVLSILKGVGTIIIGALMSWIGAFITYGFGEVVEYTGKIAKK